MAIFDCFQYFNEDHIADLRFNTLDEFVDTFEKSKKKKAVKKKSEPSNLELFMGVTA